MGREVDGDGKLTYKAQGAPGMTSEHLSSHLMWTGTNRTSKHCLLPVSKERGKSRCGICDVLIRKKREAMEPQSRRSSCSSAEHGPWWSSEPWHLSSPMY